MIYREVLGGYVVHIGCRYRRMGHIRCESKGMNGCEVEGAMR